MKKKRKEGSTRASFNKIKQTNTAVINSRKNQKFYKNEMKL